MNVKQETPIETIERCEKHAATWVGDKIEFQPVGVDVPRALAKAIFERHDFGKFVVEEPGPEAALRDSSKRGHNPAGYFCRPFVHPNKDTPLSIHVTRVTGRDESGDKYDCLARVRIGYRDDGSGKMVPFAVARPPEGETHFSDSVARERAIWIANATNHRLGHVLTADVSRAIRLALDSTGAVKSLGGGNNYWVPAAIAERVHEFLDDITRNLSTYYLRAPLTTLGAEHTRAAMGQAAQATLEEELCEMEKKLQEALHEAKNPKLTKKGKPQSKAGKNKHRVALLQGIGAKLNMYESVIETRLTERLKGIRDTLESHFTTLLDGGDTVNWEPVFAGPVKPEADEQAEQEPAESAEVTAPAEVPTPEEPAGLWLPGDDEPEQPAESEKQAVAPVAVADTDHADPFGWVGT